MTSSTLRRIYDRAEVPLTSGEDRARRQVSMLMEVLRGATGPALILDVGCGDGAATELAALASPGHRVIGLDWSADAVRRVRGRGLAVVRAGAENGLPVATGAADVVIMSELIEHVVDTDATLD